MRKMFAWPFVAGFAIAAQFVQTNPTYASSLNSGTVTISVLHVGRLDSSNEFPIYIDLINGTGTPVIITNDTLRLIFTASKQRYYMDAYEVDFMSGNSIAGSGPFQVSAHSEQTIVAVYSQLTYIPNGYRVGLWLHLGSKNFYSGFTSLRSGDAYDLAAQQQQQAKQQTARDLANREQKVLSLGSSVFGDISQLQQDDSVPTGDLKSMLSDLKTEQSDADATIQAEHSVAQEAIQHPHGNNGQVGADAAGVGADAAQVAADQAQVAADQAQVQYNLSAISQDVSILNSDYQFLWKAERALPRYHPTGLPSRQGVLHALKQAKSDYHSYIAQMSQYVKKSNQLAHEANQYANMAQSIANKTG